MVCRGAHNMEKVKEIQYRYGTYGNEYTTLEEFLENAYNIHLSVHQLDKIKNYMVALSCAIRIEIEKGYILEDSNGCHLTSFLKKFINISEEKGMYFRPLVNVLFYFNGLTVIHIHSVELKMRG